MSMFDDVLKNSESLFRDALALDYDYLPKLVPYREGEQKYIATCIKPLFAKRSGKNVLVHGPPGIGKTVAIKHLFKELEETTDDVVPLYVNCWQKNTSFKVLVDICDQVGYKFTHNKKTDEIFDVVKEMLNKKTAVFCFDEIDKAEELDFLYMILEQVYRKTIILITNFKIWAVNLDTRLKSRLMLEELEFRRYNASEIKGILQERVKYAFVEDVWTDEAFLLAAKHAAEMGDVRSGLYLLRESGNAAEDAASRKIEVKHVKDAVSRLGDFMVKKVSDLSEEEQKILKLVKDNSGKKIGELYDIYKSNSGEGVYKTFQRRIEKLSRNKYVGVSKTQGGPEGNTTIVKYERETKLDEY